MSLPPEDAALLAGLRAGDRTAYRKLVQAHHANLVRLATLFTRGVRATAEEVVQDAWIAALTGIAGFSGEAPIRAWLGGIVVNKAKTRASRDGRMISFADLAQDESQSAEPAVDPARFAPDGHWADTVPAWDAITPEREASGRQQARHLAEALDALPPAQRGVVMLHDVQGLDPAQVCAALGISEANRRVLLHRARAKLRAALEKRDGHA